MRTGEKGENDEPERRRVAVCHHRLLPRSIPRAFSCPGTGWKQCQSTTEGPCGAELTCFGIDTDLVCGSSCKNGEACATGFECTEVNYQGISVGKYCKK